MKTTFKYTGSEALEMVKEVFPKTYEIEIQKSTDLIQSLMNVYKKSEIEAYQKYLNTGCSVDDSIVILAALHLMLKKKIESKKATLEEIQKLQEQQQNIINQQEALESSINTSRDDKQILRQFYSRKQNECSKRIEQLLNSIEVVGAQVIEYQTKIFTERNQ